jgi:hypothetical protein
VGSWENSTSTEKKTAETAAEVEVFRVAAETETGTAIIMMISQCN